MSTIKEASTQNENKRASRQNCPVSYTVSKIGGHWKPVILYHLMSGEKRYSELRRAMPEITEKMLIQHLKELQADDLVVRTATPVVPPFVTYRLSAAGIHLKPVMQAMAKWAQSDHRRRQMSRRKTVNDPQ